MASDLVERLRTESAYFGDLTLTWMQPEDAEVADRLAVLKRRVDLLTEAADALSSLEQLEALRSGADGAWLRRTLEREKYTGHCGEENKEIRARHDHNDRIDRLIAALSAAPPVPGCGGGGEDTRARSQPCADAGTHIPRSPEQWEPSAAKSGEGVNLWCVLLYPGSRVSDIGVGGIKVRVANDALKTAWAFANLAISPPGTSSAEGEGT